VSGRAVRIGKWVVLACWLGILIAALPLSGKLSGAQSNDPTSFLPATAESTQALIEQRGFPGGTSLPTVLVYARDSGLSLPDLAAIEAVRQRLGTSGYADTPVGPVTRSPDGNAALLTVAVPGASGTDQQQALAAVHSTARLGLPDRLAVALTGPGGAAFDQGAVGAGIDSTLLIINVAVVVAVLLLTYRSPLLSLAPLLAVGAAVLLAQGGIYLLTTVGLVVNVQSASILTVLVFGVGTDYALLLTARYREELHRHPDRHTAMGIALRRALPAITASAATVAAALLCLLTGQLNSNRGLGPVGALGVLAALAAMATLLPALLVLGGRWLFWPRIPRPNTTPGDNRAWDRVATLIGHRPRATWVSASLILVALAFGLFDLGPAPTPAQAFTGHPESVTGQQLVAGHFPAGTATPATILTDAPAAAAVTATAQTTPGVATVTPGTTHAGRVALTVTLTQPDGPAAETSITALRERVHAVPDARAMVGGPAATNLDTHQATSHDRQVVIPLVLLVVLVVLGLILRALLAPLLLLATVVLSYLAALGASAVIDNQVLGLPGTDPSVPLFGFIFLVALGVDYNIFLMSRVREEAPRYGTRTGMLRGLIATGGVITSAGVVLAAVFAVLTVLPLVPFIEIGVVVALGVLIDTFLVRSLLVPALTYDLGEHLWWPATLSHPKTPTPADPTLAAAARRCGTEAQS